MAVACDSCGRPVNERATQCPHCGARRDTAGPLTLSGDEAKALLAMNDRGSAPAGAVGAFAMLVLPHERTHGSARTAELVLTVLGSPVVLLGAPMVLLSGRMLRRSVHTTTSELSAVAMVGLLGAPLAYSVAKWIVGSAPLALAIATVMLGALVMRGMIRSGVTHDRSRLLSALDEPTAAAVPVARVVASSSRPGALQPLAGAAPAREPASVDEPGDGPRLLR